MAGANGEEEIVGKFREVYSSLYNSCGSGDEMFEIKRQVHLLVDSENSLEEIIRFTGEVVKKAVVKMKPSKADVSGSFTSDALLHAPDSFFDLLALVYRSWLVHGTVTPSLLACAFLPLLKSSLKDPADTNSYRAIAGSSLLLKLFDQCVLQLWGHLLTSDSLQFGYKEGTGTVQCSWLVMEVANYYIRAGSQPIMNILARVVTYLGSTLLEDQRGLHVPSLRKEKLETKIKVKSSFKIKPFDLSLVLVRSNN